MGRRGSRSRRSGATRRLRWRLGAVAAGLIVTGTWAPATASADLASLKAACVTRDALDDDTANGSTLPYRFCDDGIPDQGGREPNEGAVKAVAVPQRYEGVEGLPDKALPPDPDSGADSQGNVALDIDVSLPDRQRFPPPDEGYPLVVMMHGCCAGSKTGWERDTIEPQDAEGWHYSNAWFASRGYVVLTYTARGFVSGERDGNRGSTGETQIDDLRYEINDYQSLAGQLADHRFFKVDPKRVVTTGGSYGGGFSWLALTDPLWKSPQGKRMRLIATGPKYGWTDIVYSLVPNGLSLRDRLPPFDRSDAEQLGAPKQSITLGLYASGRFGVPPGSAHATFPPKIDQAIACLNSSDPYESNPACTSTLEVLLPEFLDFRSAYYRNGFFKKLREGRIKPVPVYSAGTLTDTLFTAQEHRRMAERLKKSVQGYPIQEFYGDYQHFTQNKAKEWGDLCGRERERCSYSDYPHGDLDARPRGLWRDQGEGPTMRLNRFIDHYARPQAHRNQGRPDFDVTASLQICPENATDKRPEDAPGHRYTATRFDLLAPHTLRIELTGTQVTTNKSVPADPHAVKSDPVENQVSNGNRCPVEEGPAGTGVATYDSPALPRGFTMIGQTRLEIDHTGAGPQIQLNARLYDLFPGGEAVLVDRGVRVLDGPDGPTVLDLQANGWHFAKGHSLRLEIAQDNGPYIKPYNQSSSLVISGVTMRVPVRQRSLRLGPAAADRSGRRGDERRQDGDGLPDLPDLPDLPSLPDLPGLPGLPGLP